MTESLNHIAPGVRVQILEVLNDELKPKLMEMGLIKGRQIEVLFCAPFGGPIAIDVNGYVLSLRLDEAALIQVESINEPVNSAL